MEVLCVKVTKRIGAQSEAGNFCASKEKKKKGEGV
jgi:hypothetical protein